MLKTLENTLRQIFFPFSSPLRRHLIFEVFFVRVVRFSRSSKVRVVGETPIKLYYIDARVWLVNLLDS